MTVRAKVLTNPKYRINSINESNQELRLTCLSNNSNLHLTLDDLIKKSDILEGCGALQASLIGFYYGMHYRQSCHGQSNALVPFNCFEPHPATLYQITSISREGVIRFLDIRLQSEREATLALLFANDGLLRCFSSLQACYIGIMVGMRADHYPQVVKNRLSAAHSC